MQHTKPKLNMKTTCKKLQRLKFALGFGIGVAIATSGDAQSDNDDIYELSPFEISAEEDQGYGATQTMGGTRVNMDLVDVPVNVFTLNQELLEDVSVSSFGEIATFNAGSTKSGSPRANMNTLRGVVVGASTFRDGISEQTAISGSSINSTFNIERVEIIKGPSGVLFGAHPIGGVINRVSKKPFKGTGGEIGASYRSFYNGESSYEGTLDWNQTIGSDQQFQYRVMAKAREGTMEHGGEDDTESVTMHFNYDVNKNSDLWLRSEYTREAFGEKRGTWWIDRDGNVPAGLIPVDRKVGNLQDPNEGQRGNKKNVEIGYKTNFDIFNTSWNARALARYSRVDGTFRITLNPFKTVVDGQGNELGPIGRGDPEEQISFDEFREIRANDPNADILLENFLTRGRDFSREGFQFTLDLTSSFDIGPTTHTFFTYLEKGESDIYENWFRWDHDFQRQSVFNTTGAPPEEFLSNFRIEGNRPELTESDSFAWAAQDHISMWENRIHFVGGARYDSGRSGRISLPEAPEPGVVADEFNTNTDWTFKWGVVLKPFEGFNENLRNVSLFFNDSETFQPNETTNQLGEKLPNITGEMEEYGVKYSLFDRRLNGTFSVFEISEENVRDVVLTEIDGEFVQVTRPIGSRDIEGWDFDLFFNPIDEIDLMFSLQDMQEAEVGAAGIGSGQQPRNIPVGFNWTAVGKYTFLDGPLDGLSLGLNFRKTKERAGDFADTFRVPGSDILGLVASYEIGNWKVQLNIENIEDEEFVDTTVADFLISPGPPINSTLSLTYSFGGFRDRKR